MAGTIIKALSGFYYVQDGGRLITCRARGKFRHNKVTPLVGDLVEYTPLEQDTGMVDKILPRKNEFFRPAVANMDQLIVVASDAIPVTDPFLIDRVAAIAELAGCEPVICVNKCDLEPGDHLLELYARAGFQTLALSAQTGEGVEALRRLLRGKTSVFTGNSGVGKSSLLNALAPALALPTGDVSEKLGRGRHTTRHIELFRLEEDTFLADTPGFSSFDAEQSEFCDKEALQTAFREFRPYLSGCRFVGCAHVKEKGCAVLQAVKEGKIARSRHESYVRLYEKAKENKAWETK